MPPLSAYPCDLVHIMPAQHAEPPKPQGHRLSQSAWGGDWAARGVPLPPTFDSRRRAAIIPKTARKRPTAIMSPNMAIRRKIRQMESRGSQESIKRLNSMVNGPVTE